MAADEGNLKIAEFLLQHCNADINTEDISNDDETPLILASNNGHLDVVGFLLLHSHIDLNKGSKTGYTALHWVSALGHFGLVDLILRHTQLDVNTGNVWGETALHLASTYGHSEAVGLLLQHLQIDVNKEKNNGQTALWIAFEQGHMDVAELLLNHPEIDVLKGDAINDNKVGKLLFGHDNVTDNEKILVSAVIRNLSHVHESLKGNVTSLDINFDDKRGMTALIWASKNGHLEIVRTFLNTSLVDINKERKIDRATALMLACYNGHSDVVDILLNQTNIALDMRTSSKADNALLMVSLKGHKDVLNQLIATKQVDINDINSNGESSLFKASQNGHVEVVKILLGYLEIDVNMATVDRVTPLMVSSQGIHHDVVELLLVHPKIKANFASYNGKTALFFSIAQNYNVDHKKLQRLVELLLQCPAINIHHRDEKDHEASYYAANAGFENLTVFFEPKNQAILKMSGHTCCSDKVNDGLQIAAGKGDIMMVKAFLLCPQLDLNDGYKYSVTPLFLATENDQTEVVKALLEDQRIDVNVVVNFENALMKATENENSVILELFLEHPSIDVNQNNLHNKKTALIVAAELGNPHVVEILLRHPQTFVNSLDSHSDSALQKAVVGKHFGVFELLLRCPKTIIPVEIEALVGDTLFYDKNLTVILEQGPTCCHNANSGLLVASWKNDFRAIRGLLECPNADINAESMKGYTPIYIASWLGYIASLEVLISNSYLEVNKVKILDHSSGFSKASERGNFEAMRILIGHKHIDVIFGWCADNWARHRSLCTASDSKNSAKPGEVSSQNSCTKFKNITRIEEFFSAAKSGDDIQIEALLKADESFVHCESTNAFLLASENGQAQIVKMLLELTPINPNRFTESSKTALILASQNNHLNVVEVLLEHEELDVNLAEPVQGETPLYILSKNGRLNITSLLLQKSGIDVNKYTINRESPLMAAALGGYSEIVVLLLAHAEMDVSFTDFNGRNALMHALMNGTSEHEKQKELLTLFIRCPSFNLHHRDESANNITDYANESNITDIKFDLIHVITQRERGHTCCSPKVNDGLQIAANEGDFFMVQSFLQCLYADVNEGYKYEQTPLFLASMQNHIDVVEILLADSRTDVNKVVNSEHALLAATKEENSDIVELLLLHQEIDVNKINLIDRKTALIIASESGFHDIVWLLLKHPQTFVNNVDSYSETALQKAVHGDYGEVVKLILRCTKTIIPKDIKSNATDILDAIKMRDELLLLGHTCCLHVKNGLLSAAENGDFRALRGLLQCPDANINTHDDRGRTPIYLSSWKRNIAALEVLLGHQNLDVNMGRIKEGSTAFSIASQKGHFIIMKKLIGHEETNANVGWITDNWTNYIIHGKETNINGPNNVMMNETSVSNRNEEFMSAARNGNSTKVQSLLDLGLVDINRADENGKTALYEACKNGHLEVVQVLLNNSLIDLNKQEPDYGETPLYAASHRGFSHIVTNLIRMDQIDVNKSTKNRTTPLMASSASGHLFIVELLLTHPNIDPNYATFKGQTSLFYLIIGQNVTRGLQGEIANRHLRCPIIDIQKIDEYEQSARMYAREKNLTEILEAFADRSSLMKDGHTCCSDQVNDGLQIAAEQGNLKMLKSFLRCSQVDLNFGYKFGVNPLYQASNKGHTSLVEELLKDPRTEVNIEVNSGTALYIAAKHGNTKVVTLLLNHHDIDVNKINTRNKLSVLMIAIDNGYVDIVKLLLFHSQTDVNIIGAKDESAISIASTRASVRSLKLLLRCPKTNVTGWVKKEKDYYGPHIKEVLSYHSELTKLRSTCCLKVRESLLRAAWIGDDRGIKGLLLCPDADINVVDGKGRTPLYIASWLRHAQVVHVLLSNKNIDVNTCNSINGNSPFSIASKKGHFEIMEKLINHVEMKEGKGWNIDGWASLFTRSKYKFEPTATYTTIESTTRRERG